MILLSRLDTHEFAVFWTLDFESDHSIRFREEGVITSTADIFPRVKPGATLTNDYVAWNNWLSVE